MKEAGNWFLGQFQKPKTYCQLLFLSILLGCGSPPPLVPLAVGAHWDYRFRWGLERETGRVEVVREVPVGGGTGWELRSPMGVSRLGYRGDRLVASQLGGAFLTPPLPIGVPVGSRAVWHGRVASLKGETPGSAVVEADKAKVNVAGAPRAVNRTVVTMRVDGKTVELTTWYAPGEGLLQQEQRTNERLDLALERIGG